MVVFRLQDAKEHGLARSAVERGVREGGLIKVARGIYAPSAVETADLDWVEAATRRPDGTICLVSALAYHDLIDDIPSALDVAIPRPARVPAGTNAIAWHLFDAPSFEVGRERTAVPGVDVRSWIYAPERCIVDAVRLRGRLGYETGIEAMKNWLNAGGRPAALMKVAGQVPRSTSAIHAALQVLS